MLLMTNEESASPLDELLTVTWPSRSEPGDGAAWDAAFERLLSFMTRDDAIEDDRRPFLSDLAAEKLGRALPAEADTRYDFVWPPVLEVRKRLDPILAAIEARERREPGALEAFSYGYGCLNLHRYHKLLQVLILDWLQPLRDTGLDTPGRLIAEIRLWPWGDSESRARPKLIEFLSHENLLVRAVAANELGKTLDDIEPQYASEWSMVASVLEAVKTAEVARPGVASAFIWGLSFFIQKDPRLQQWVFDVLLARTGPELEVPYFNSLEWVAAEDVLNQSPGWIPKLVEVGKEDLANWVALSTKVRSPEVAAHLAAMTSLPDDSTARDAATELVLRYARTTPEASARGFVSVIDGHPLLKMFAIYDHDDLDHARVLSFYPRHPRRTLTTEEANSLVDAVLPTELRGEETFERWPTRGRRQFANRVYVTYHFGSEKSHRIQRVEVIGNGIQGPDWDPVALFRDWADEAP